MVEIDHIVLLKQLPLVARYDVLPFLLTYPFVIYYSMSLYSQYKSYAFIAFGVILSIHLVIFLIARGSIAMRAFLGFTIVQNIKNAKFVFVKPLPNMGNQQIVPLCSRNRKGDVKIVGLHFELKEYYFEFQKLIFNYEDFIPTESKSNLKFHKQIFPNYGLISNYLLWSGHTETTLAISKSIWGKNTLRIPLPDFIELYIEHLIAPFFLFQGVCLILWSLDDYWYYSFFTFLMLMIFEGMLCQQRRNSVLMLRNMRKPPFPVVVYRLNTWNVVSSEDIVPGDIITLAIYGNEAEIKETQFILPCDCLILSGSCITNEAQLTGESIPQIKESLEFTTLKSFDISNGIINDELKRHVLFSGTTLIQDIASTTTSADSVIPTPPLGHCVALVIQTGFRTSQVSLQLSFQLRKSHFQCFSMRTILI